MSTSGWLYFPYSLQNEVANMKHVSIGAFTVGSGDPQDAAVAALLRRSEAYAHSLYPPESVHMLAVEQLISPSVRFLVARCNETGDVLGCGALVLQSGSCAELKRMFVETAARRRGVGAEILRTLEKTALAEGIDILQLETGPSQPEAIALYRRFGYQERGPFGDYIDDPLSVFMEKRCDG